VHIQQVGQGLLLDVPEYVHVIAWHTYLVSSFCKEGYDVCPAAGHPDGEPRDCLSQAFLLGFSEETGAMASTLKNNNLEWQNPLQWQI
jgi:hypothetical protein